eukprot:20718-Pelagococcus_subviridis.AAC.3
MCEYVRRLAGDDDDDAGASASAAAAAAAAAAEDVDGDVNRRVVVARPASLMGLRASRGRKEGGSSESDVGFWRR